MPSTGYGLLDFGLEGRRPAIPQKWDGIPIEPVVSLPNPAGTIRAATAAAVPPLDPPGMRERS